MQSQENDSASPPVDLGLWGKSAGLPHGVTYPVVCHLLDTAAVALMLWERFVPGGLRARIAAGLGVTEGDAGRLIGFWAGLHDIGKVVPSFQGQDELAFARLAGYPGTPADPLKHDFAVHVWLSTALQRVGYAPDGLLPRAPAGRVGGAGRAAAWRASRVLPSCQRAGRS